MHVKSSAMMAPEQRTSPQAFKRFNSFSKFPRRADRRLRKQGQKREQKRGEEHERMGIDNEIRDEEQKAKR